MTLSLHALELRAPDGRLLLAPQDFQFDTGLTALVGANGAGKSTLLRVLAGVEPPDGGRVLGPAGSGLLDPRQVPPPDWRLPAHASPGQRAHAWLAWAMRTPASLWLLDEPSAHLDANARSRMLAWMRRLHVPVLVASHDRAVLRMADQVVELVARRLRRYRGDYGHFLQSRAENEQRTLEALERERQRVRMHRQRTQQARERAEQRVARGAAEVRKGSQGPMLQGYLRGRADQASRSRERAARARLAAAEAARDATRAQLDLRPEFRLDLPEAGLPPGKRLIEARGVRVHGAASATPRDWRLLAGERWRVQGPNGAGKTRWLRAMAGAESPLAGDVWRAAMALALVDQEAGGLDDRRSVLANFLGRQPMPEAAARERLAWFRFRGDDVHRDAGSLSAGERMRLALTCELGGPQPPAALLLDEPDNHLDLPSLLAVECALAQYRGALVVVSHDAEFLATVAVTQVLRLD